MTSRSVGGQEPDGCAAANPFAALAPDTRSKIAVMSAETRSEAAGGDGGVRGRAIARADSLAKLAIMKSTDVYALLRAELGPWFKSTGFKRAKGLLSWWRPQGPASTVVWCQISQDGWDDYAGSKFVVEFQRSLDSTPSAMPSRRARLARLMSADARGELLAIQNAVISSLQAPPESYFKLHISESVTRWYRKNFEPVTAAYSERDDVWLRYAAPTHVTNWARFILAQLPACVAAAESWSTTA